MAEPAAVSLRSPDARQVARPEAARWSAIHRVAFRFLFAFLVLYLEPFPFGSLPFTSQAAETSSNAWDAVIPWVGKRLLTITAPIPMAQTGSGDRTADYVALLIVVALALAATATWSLIDRRRAQYVLLAGYLRVYVRYALAAIMLSYGLYKVFPSQFPAPPAGTLVSTYGENSPMKLLWTFMGFSKPYEIFTGCLECLGASLLFFRRTTTLGAFVLVGVIGNVVMLNFCYDVPVKLHSSMLLGMALFLLAPDARRVIDVLVRNRLAEPADLGALARSPRGRRIWFALKVIVIALLVGARANQAWGAYRGIADLYGGPLGGYYAVEESSGDRSLDFVEITSWAVFIRHTDGARDGYALGPYDAAKKTVVLSRRVEGGERKSWTLTADKGQDGTLLLAGRLADENIRAHLRRSDPVAFPLTKRGFHWINEFPYNR